MEDLSGFEEADGGGADLDGDSGGAEAGEAAAGGGALDFGLFHEAVVDGEAVLAGDFAVVELFAEGGLILAVFVEAPFFVGAHEAEGEAGGEAEGVAVVVEEFGLLEATEESAFVGVERGENLGGP